MKISGKFFILLLLTLLIAACAGESETNVPAGPAAPEGPAFILFYTDN